MIPCSRSASSPSTSSAKSILSPSVPCLRRVALERGELIVENEALLVEQAADQRRFAVIDRAAGEQPEGRKRWRASRAEAERGCEGVEHQK